MGRSISEVRNSKRAEARNLFRKSPVIEVFVENEDDIIFWKGIFRSYQISVKIYPAIKSVKRLERGKSVVLKKAEQAGKFLLLCVDSDYDYLFQNDTKGIHSNPYIFQTYTYSFENHLCNPAEMEMMCIRAVLVDEIDFDFVHFFEHYSAIIFDLCTLHLYYKKVEESVFSLKEFHQIIALPQTFKVQDLTKKILPQIEKKCLQKVVELVKLYPIDRLKMNDFLIEWAKLGLEKKKTYQFIQGHFCFDLCKKLLSVICNELKKQKINDLTKTVQEKNDQKIRKQQIEAMKMKLNEYQQNSIAVEKILLLNDKYEDSFLWKKLNQDLETFKNLHHDSNT